MSLLSFNFGKPFFDVQFVSDVTDHHISGRAILLNLGEAEVRIEGQILPPLASIFVRDATIQGVDKILLIVELDSGASDEALMARIRQTWPTAFDVRGEERLRGVEHYMSPKQGIKNFAFSFYHSASVPLRVGLHKDHPFCPVPGFREVHTQIRGVGMMQQARERDLTTIYLEELMAPGTTHRPMFDAQGNYPWHQYETVTPSVFLAVEILPDGVMNEAPAP